MNPKEIAAQQIMLMAHVEDICEKQGLVPPIEVIVVDADGNQYDFEYRPENDGVDLPPVSVIGLMMAVFPMQFLPDRRDFAVILKIS